MVYRCCWRKTTEGEIIKDPKSSKSKDPEKEKLIKRQSAESSFSAVSSVNSGHARQSHAYEDECDRRLEDEEDEVIEEDREAVRNSKVILADPLQDSLTDLTKTGTLVTSGSRPEKLDLQKAKGHQQKENHKLAHSPKVTFFEGTPPISPGKPSRQRQRDKIRGQTPPQRSRSAPDSSRSSRESNGLEEVTLGQKASVTSVENLGSRQVKSSSAGGSSSIASQIDDLNKV